ncbi:MAG: exoribonuclease [Xanthomonadaceae bacterium]|nr:exoribonuclease [Xanthomonadaceae bacterium]
MATTRRLHIQAADTPVIAQGVAAIKREQALPSGFPPEVEAAAARAAAAPRLPDLDRTDIPLVTLDPAGSMDLDQALHVERNGNGFRVFYAIADVAAFVAPGDAADLEAHRRGETLYGADAKVPLHPLVLSEDAASLLPDQLRPALLWTIDVDASGESTAVDVRRARVRSRAQLNYVDMQAQIDAGTADPMWAVLRAVGEVRKQREIAHGGVSLPLPEQEVRVDNGQWSLQFRARKPTEDWNEQLSLLTGMAAAQLMVQGKVGILRTLPKPESWAIDRLRRTAKALGIAWPPVLSYPQFIAALDPAQPRNVAMMVACTTVLRGAGYVAFNGNLPVQPMHWGLAAQYAHATAPLRRLVDRYVGETCVALCAGQPVPGWVLEALPGLPATMADADRRASRFERAVLDLAETLTLSTRVGDTFAGAIVEVERDDHKQGVVVVRDPAISAPVTGSSDLPLGDAVTVRLLEADVATRTTRFELA